MQLGDVCSGLHCQLAETVQVSVPKHKVPGPGHHIFQFVSNYSPAFALFPYSALVVYSNLRKIILNDTLPFSPFSCSFSKMLLQKEELEQKHLHLVQIVESEKTAKWQYTQQCEELTVEIKKLRSEVSCTRSFAFVCLQKKRRR